MKLIVPFGMTQDSPNPLLTRAQDLMLYQAHLEMDWIVRFTLHLWQILFNESGRYVRECIESELDHAFVDHFETADRLDNYDERMASIQFIEQNHNEFVMTVYEVYQKLLPYLGGMPCRPSVDVLESFDIAPHGNTAMIIDMQFESDKGGGL